MNEPTVLLTIDQAAHLLGVGRTFLYCKLLGNELAVVRLGRAVRVPRASVEQYVARLVEESAESVAHRPGGYSDRLDGTPTP